MDLDEEVEMNRRDFLKLQAKGAFWLTLGTSGLLLPKTALSTGSPDIVEVKGPAAAAARAAVDLLGGMKHFVKPGNRVLIKPNMSFPHSSFQATNTSPEVVRELAVLCKEAGAANILILDHTLHGGDKCLDRSGIREACKAVEKNMVFAADQENLYKEVTIPEAKSLLRTQILKEALKSDVLIAVPVAKSHTATGVSLSMKGMMGLVWDRLIMHRQNLSQGIVDICTQLKADLTVIDGSRVLATNGPHGPGEVLFPNTIIASKDMVSADAYAVSCFEWYGKRYKPRQVRHIREAHERGIGRMDIENLIVKKVSL